jgi:hypothetical protein
MVSPAAALNDDTENVGAKTFKGALRIDHPPEERPKQQGRTFCVREIFFNHPEFQISNPAFSDSFGAYAVLEVLREYVPSGSLSGDKQGVQLGFQLVARPAGD